MKPINEFCFFSHNNFSMSQFIFSAFESFINININNYKYNIYYILININYYYIINNYK